MKFFRFAVLFIIILCIHKYFMAQQSALKKSGSAQNFCIEKKGSLCA